MLFTVSTKACSFGGLSNIESTKNVTVSGFDQNTLINLIICRNSELMAGFQYPQTTRSLLKTGLLLIYYIIFVFDIGVQRKAGVLLEQQPLASKQIIIWHDVLNNSISSHSTNNYMPCPLDELLAYLQSKRRQISGIVYCRRTGAPDIFEDLRNTEIIVVKTTDSLISRRKRQNPVVLREYLQLKQSSELELKSLRVVLSHRDHPPGTFSKIRAQIKKPSQGRRSAKARRAEVLAGELQPEPNDQ